jgi:uncharacterized protein involved in exopolysaccharide biosynthesis
VDTKLSDPGELTLAGLIQILWQEKLIVVLVTFVVTAMAVLIAIFMTPIYRAEVVISPVSDEGASGTLSSLAERFGGLASLVGGGDIGGRSNIEENIAILESRSFTKEFIEVRNLVPVLFHDIWDAENSEWLVDDPRRIPSLEDARRRFVLNVRGIYRDAKSGLLTVSIEWTDPEVAADWANDLVASVNEKIRRRAILEAEKSIEFLKRELNKTTIVELEQAAYSLLAGEIKTIMLANVQEQYAFRVIDPAAPPDFDDPVRPNKLLIVFVGGMFGGVLGCLLGLFRASRRGRQARQAE